MNLMIILKGCEREALLSTMQQCLAMSMQVSKMMHAVQALHAVGGSVMDSEGTPAKPRALLDVW